MPQTVTQARPTSSFVLYKNIAVSFLYKALNIGAQFVLVRMTLACLQPTEYGVWLTISSFLLWLTIFDFGFTNGLRNKVTQAYIDQRFQDGQNYISTAYAFLLVVSGALFLVFTVLTAWVNWPAVFNAPVSLAGQLPLVVIASFGLFCLRLTLNLVTAVLLAVHRAAYVEGINALIQLATLGGLYGWSVRGAVSLLDVALIYSLMPLVVLMLATLLVFNRTYRPFRPARHAVRRELLRELGTVGGKFFGLQLASLVLFTSQNFIISHLFDPAEVTPFNIAYRYFSVIPIVFNLVLVPHWAAVTEAYHRKDFDWITRTLTRLVKLWGGFTLLALVMIALAAWVYDLWLGKDHLPITFTLTLTLGLSTIVMVWGNLFSLFLNAMGVITLQMFVAPVILVISIPLSIYLASFPGLGVSGVPLAFTLCLLPGAIFQPYQCYLLLTQRARGIWAR